MTRQILDFARHKQRYRRVELKAEKTLKSFALYFTSEVVARKKNKYRRGTIDAFSSAVISNLICILSS